MKKWSAWELTNAASRPYVKKALCSVCGLPFKKWPGGWWKDLPAMVRECQVNEFRGDDEVEFAHPACTPRPKAGRG